MKSKSKKSYGKRLRVTRKGKVLRRAMGLGHSRANKSSKQMRRKTKSRGIATLGPVFKRHLSQ